MKTHISHGAGSHQHGLNGKPDWFVVLPDPRVDPVMHMQQVGWLVRAGRTVIEIDVEPWNGFGDDHRTSRAHVERVLGDLAERNRDDTSVFISACIHRARVEGIDGEDGMGTAPEYLNPITMLKHHLGFHGKHLEPSGLYQHRCRVCGRTEYAGP